MRKKLQRDFAGLAMCLSFSMIYVTVTGQCKQNMQRLDYTMDIQFNAAKNNFTGYQKLIYQNDSPDTLVNIFYHLFYNAFQPGSQMDERALHIRDQEGFTLKLHALKADECGFQQIDSLKINGENQSYSVSGTILKINPSYAVFPNDSVQIELWFKSQVPKMIIRTGRNNPEQIAFTMTQWYPKVAAYDRSGWHADEYIRREFYGGFANFDVTIHMDSAYTVAATGVLQNPEACGHGYVSGKHYPGTNKNFLDWHFRAMNVHDFAWAADTSYIHTQQSLRNGLDLHCFYKKETATLEDWQNMPQDVAKIFNWMETKVGPYPYPGYSLVQGGSGGTEYPMLSMILGKRPVNKGLSKGYPIIILALHEIMHNWWYAAVANDETRNAWLDEGFALFFQYEYLDELNKNNKQEKSISTSYEYLRGPMRINALEPMTTPSDYYDANWAYDASVYHKGAVFLNQLRYIVGDELFWTGMRNYYSRWTFGHPDGDDFILCMEKASGMQLKWYLDLWTKTNKTIDYAIGDVQNNTKGTTIRLLCRGTMVMPLDVRVTLKTGAQFNYNIPLASMYGRKTAPGLIPMAPWGWTDPEYLLTIPYTYETVSQIEIDPEKNLMDLIPENNSLKFPITNKNKH